MELKLSRSRPKSLLKSKRIRPLLTRRSPPNLKALMKTHHPNLPHRSQAKKHSRRINKPPQLRNKSKTAQSLNKRSKHHLHLKIQIQRVRLLQKAKLAKLPIRKNKQKKITKLRLQSLPKPLKRRKKRLKLSKRYRKLQPKY